MSEFDWIARYFAPLATKDGAAGLLDDVAALSSTDLIITNDALVEGVHFLPGDPLDTVAQKLVRVNVSDVLAKGCYPDQAVLTLGWPNGRPESDLATFAAGLGAALNTFEISLIGGDTVGSPHGLFLSLTLTGKPAGPRAPVRRSGAKVGDVICVTGVIGVGVVGLTAALDGEDTLTAQRYRVPELPTPDIAAVIAEYANASMDVSDGLIGDLEKLLIASGCGGELVLDLVPLFQPSSELDDVLWQATGGDDYQCLFTLPEVMWEQGHITSAAKIGTVQAEAGLRLSWQGQLTEMPKQGGFQHG